MNARKIVNRKRSIRRRSVRMSFSELVQKLWQPEPEAVELQVAEAKQKKYAGSGKRIRRKKRLVRPLST